MGTAAFSEDGRTAWAYRTDVLTPAEKQQIISEVESMREALYKEKYRAAKLLAENRMLHEEKQQIISEVESMREALKKENCMLREELHVLKRELKALKNGEN
jgi:small-conductance mechanosensitive channel